MAGLPFAGLLVATCFYFFIFFIIFLYFKASVSAVCLGVFQSTDCIVHSYCFLLCFEYLLNFLIIIIITRSQYDRLSQQQLRFCFLVFNCVNVPQKAKKNILQCFTCSEIVWIADINRIYNNEHRPTYFNGTLRPSVFSKIMTDSAEILSLYLANIAGPSLS